MNLSFLDNLELTAAIIGSVVAIVWAGLGNTSAALAVCGGTVIAMINFRAIRFVTKRLIAASRGAAQPGRLMTLLVGKLALLGASIWLCLTAGLNPVGLTIGLSMIFPALMVGMVRQWLGMSSPTGRAGGLAGEQR